MKSSHYTSKAFLFAFFLINVVLPRGRADAFSRSLIGTHRNCMTTKNGANFADSNNLGRVSLSTFLYKENHREELPPVFSSTSQYVFTDVDEMKTLTIGTNVAPMKKRNNAVASIFGFISDTVIDAVSDTASQKTENSIFMPRPQHYDQPQGVSLVDITWLKAHEEIVSDDRVQNLYKATLEWDAYRLPLLVDSRSGAILDGHHRYHVGRKLGLSRLPAILVDYLNDEEIDVDVWPECGLDCLTKEEVIEMSLSDKLFPPKTSKHAFVTSFDPINVALDKLR